MGASVLLKMFWPVVLFEHEPHYMMSVISKLAIQTPKLRAQLASAGVEGVPYRATEEDMVVAFFQAMADPKLGE